ncbi:MAG: hypothetical protein DDT29_01798 [Dehalococcoidia bacterium]|nr:hypothetical protein [Bacillota bacterium]
MAKEVAHRLGRVVPSCILKINEAQPAIIAQDGIVEAKIRRRQTPVLLGDFGIQCQAQFTNLLANKVGHIAPDFRQLVPYKMGCLAIDSRRIVHAPQSLQSPLHTSQMVDYAKAGFRAFGQGFGNGEPLVTVQFTVKVKRLPDCTFRDLMGQQLASLHKLVQAEAVLPVASEWLRQGTEANLPGKTGKRKLRSQAISWVIRMLKIGFQQSTRAVHLDPEYPVVCTSYDRMETQITTEARFSDQVGNGLPKPFWTHDQAFLSGMMIPSISIHEVMRWKR